MDKYNHREIESKWQKKWDEEKIYQPDLDKAKKPFYNLMMFPYPSAEGLHVGNMYAFVHSDAYGRYMRAKGYDVFEPIGLDGFGIHSENYAIKIKEHIKDVSARTEKNFYRQLHLIGNQFDWSRKLETYHPDYYKWTQWLFVQMFNKGLAYRKKANVNWCPSCKTVLSDEQIIAGKCERCSTLVEKKEMEQWFWKITNYTEKLLNNLEGLDWSEEVKLAQKNWIGRSEGARVEFKVESYKVIKLKAEEEFKVKEREEKTIQVFTTRPDTLFGCTYLVVCPEHRLVNNEKLIINNFKEVEKYVKKAKSESDIERTNLSKDKTGVKLEGIVAINPVNGEELPIFVADYVLSGYGTGAIMAVPAHDDRDFEFAKKFGLPIREVVLSKTPKISKAPEMVEEKIYNPHFSAPVEKIIVPEKVECFVGEGININSGFLDGLDTAEAKEKIIAWLEEKKVGQKEINYKLRDWCVSRQRYWGPPIPMIYCDHCGWQAVPEKDLPVLLPEVEDFLPDGSGKGPLNKIADFVKTTCPNCGGEARRETDVSDPFVDSSWYFMRYLCTDFKDQALDKDRLKKWMPINMYVGGKEHSVLHLLYSRFVTMVMHELGYAPEAEPFKKFRTHGLMIKDGAKMSKSKGNVINPDVFVEVYGADAVRLYLMFLGDMRQGGDWRDSGMNGAHKFIVRLYNLFEQVDLEKEKGKENEELKELLHKTIKAVGEDLDSLKFNTAIAKLMVLVNKIQETKCTRETFSALVIMLIPFAPHLAEELWEKMGNKKSIILQKWPTYDPALAQGKTFNIAVQVNGKTRDVLEITADATEEEIRVAALGSAKINKWIEGKEIKKVIYVQGRVVSLIL
jgi:leucyl-tRNA synthetase